MNAEEQNTAKSEDTYLGEENSSWYGDCAYIKQEEVQDMHGMRPLELSTTRNIVVSQSVPSNNDVKNRHCHADLTESPAIQAAISTVLGNKKWARSMIHIYSFCCCLKLSSDTISSHAKDILTEFYESLIVDNYPEKEIRLRDQELEVHVASSIFIACRSMQVAHSYAEISSLTGVPRKQIAVAVRRMLVSVNCVALSQESNIGDFVRRFSASLMLPLSLSNAAESLAGSVREFEGVYGRNYLTIAATCIYVVTSLSSDEHARSREQIGKVVGVSSSCMNLASAAMYPHLDRVLPPDFLREKPLSVLLGAKQRRKLEQKATELKTENSSCTT